MYLGVIVQPPPTDPTGQPFNSLYIAPTLANFPALLRNWQVRTRTLFEASLKEQWNNRFAEFEKLLAAWRTEEMHRIVSEAYTSVAQDIKREMPALTPTFSFIDLPKDYDPSAQCPDAYLYRPKQITSFAAAPKPYMIYPSARFYGRCYKLNQQSGYTQEVAGMIQKDVLPLMNAAIENERAKFKTELDAWWAAEQRQFDADLLERVRQLSTLAQTGRLTDEILGLLAG